MRLYPIRGAGIWLAVMLRVSATVVGQKTTKAGNQAAASDETNLVAAVRWHVAGKQGHLRCEVWQQNSAATDSGPTRALSVYREDDGGHRKIFAFETPDSLLNLYPLGDYDARLFTTWVSGSAYHVRIFAVVDGHVKEVLEQGTKVPPEVLYDDQGHETVLITTPVMENGKWTSVNGTTTVFKWTGEKFEKIGTVPWKKRVQCLSKESCAALK